MKSLDKFAAMEISNTQEVKGGTFGCFSLVNLCAPKPTCYTPPAPCYTPPAPSCNTGGYSNNNNCAPKPSYCLPKISFSFSFGWGC